MVYEPALVPVRDETDPAHIVLGNFALPWNAEHSDDSNCVVDPYAQHGQGPDKEDQFPDLVCNRMVPVLQSVCGSPIEAAVSADVLQHPGDREGPAGDDQVLPNPVGL